MSNDAHRPRTLKEKMRAWREANPSNEPSQPLLSNAQILDRIRSRYEWAQEAVDDMISDPTHPRHFSACELVFAYTLGKPKMTADEDESPGKIVIEVTGGFPRES